MSAEADARCPRCGRWWPTEHLEAHGCPRCGTEADRGMVVTSADDWYAHGEAE